MAEPLFRILDIVQIGDPPVLVKAGLSGQRGTVTQIREHPGPRFRYCVRSLVDDDEAVPGLYEEEDLLPTGERASTDLFALPGGFRIREIVQVSATCDNAEVAGRLGVVDGGYTGEGGLGIWIEEIGETVVVQPRFLTATGDRMPAPSIRRHARSTQVSVDGQVTGHSSYTVVDDVERYL